MKMFCLRCHMVAPPKSYTPGSIFIELILWCCFIIPGVIYSLWRMTARKKVCRHCGCDQLVPENAPIRNTL